MAYIYKVINQANGKVYIGKTTKSNIQQRWEEHQRDRKKDKCKDRPFYRALNKYGPENFSIEEIEQCDVSILEEREIYWIEYYRAYVGWDDCKGYNATTGGDGKSHCNYEWVYSLWQEGKLIKEIAKETGYCIDTVSKILSNKGITFKEKQGRAHATIVRKLVKMYSLEGEFLKEFASQSEAGKYMIDNKLTNCKQSTISQHIREVCTGRRKTAAGFKWKYID